MKKYFLVSLALFFLNSSYAQVRLGLKGGINLATVRYINADNSKARVGWNAGGLAEITIQDDLLIRPELLYSSKGFAFNATGTSNKGSLKLNYISVPILFGYRPDSKSEIFLGPEFGFLRKAVSKSLGIREDVTNFYRHFDVGVDLGFAYKISRVFGAEARYNYGFKDLVNVAIVDENGNVTGQGRNGANRVFQFGLFFMLD